MESPNALFDVLEFFPDGTPLPTLAPVPGPLVELLLFAGPLHAIPVARAVFSRSIAVANPLAASSNGGPMSPIRLPPLGPSLPPLRLHTVVFGPMHGWLVEIMLINSCSRKL